MVKITARSKDTKKNSNSDSPH
ncbi:hypothetical protein GBAR_LOCUS7061 [Geodia barretti]|uniref:Uncharacterized protein n=1 Tax=Geodia barretti TaxID=519541 RepID=A0AA35RHE3_GEOBA|nr:hypothetical protein GBAR_LOCUS7061 [Geodia barretti]